MASVRKNAPIVYPNHQTVVREEAGHLGVRHAIASEQSIPVNTPTDFNSSGPLSLGGGAGGPNSVHLQRQAAAYQQASTSREYATGAAYPAQARPAEPHREERPKNHQEFQLIGRNVGMHTSAGSNAVGGYVGAAPGAKVELAENLTQRTLGDFETYFNPTGPFRFERGNGAVYNQFYQGRQEARGPEYKDTAGRFPGAFQHEHKRPGHPQEELWRSGLQGYTPKPTMKSDPAMTHRQRADENPNREGLRMQYTDNYSSGHEELINPRRVQHTVTTDVDPNLLLAYNTNPYTVPLGIIPMRP
jgi:hypothetical protein